MFLVWTVAACLFDVEAIGPLGSAVGFSTLNKSFHALTGVHMPVYVLTDWLGLVPFAFVLGFALLGLWQWIRRRSILAVDVSLLALGAFYFTVMAIYVAFEFLSVNYRPVLIDGVLEASYPSSTTVLVICVMSTARMQLKFRMKNGALMRTCAVLIDIFIAFMVIGRLVSGVHWLSDIIGGIFLSVGLSFLYLPFAKEK